MPVCPPVCLSVFRTQVSSAQLSSRQVFVEARTRTEICLVSGGWVGPERDRVAGAGGGDGDGGDDAGGQY